MHQQSRKRKKKKKGNSGDKRVGFPYDFCLNNEKDLSLFEFPTVESVLERVVLIGAAP
jgi:hypothetical protein